MFKEKYVTECMQELGYRRVEKLVYQQIRHDSQVEHYVNFSLLGSPKQYLAVVYDFSDVQANAFALKEIRALGGQIYQSEIFNGFTSISPVYPLGRLAEWGRRDSIFLPNITISELQQKITSSIRNKLLPLANTIQTSEELCALLLSDSEPMRWYFCNGAIRAAQVVHLCHRLRKPDSYVLKSLLYYSKQIASQLSREVNVNVYIDQLIFDAKS